MAMELDDGTYVQAGLAHGAPGTENAPTSEMGVVMKAYPLAHKNNIYGQGIEYDVILANRTYVRCKSTFSRTGYKNGMDLPHNVTTGTTDGTKLSNDTPLDKMNGDHVKVAYIYNSGHLAIIVSRLPHPGSKLKEAKTTGETSPLRPILIHEESVIFIDELGGICVDVSKSKAKQVQIKTSKGIITLKEDDFRVETGLDMGLEREIRSNKDGVRISATDTEVDMTDVKASITSDEILSTAVDTTVQQKEKLWKLSVGNNAGDSFIEVAQRLIETSTEEHVERFSGSHTMVGSATQTVINAAAMHVMSAPGIIGPTQQYLMQATSAATMDAAIMAISARMVLLIAALTPLPPVPPTPAVPVVTGDVLRDFIKDIIPLLPIGLSLNVTSKLKSE